MPRKQLKNPNLPEPQGYSRAVSASGRTLIVTSMTAPVDKDGSVVGFGDAQLQAERVMTNLRDILNHNGASFDDVVKVSAYVIRKEDAGAVMKVMGAAFGPPPPAMALAVVVGLPNPDFLVEIEVTALVQ